MIASNQSIELICKDFKAAFFSVVYQMLGAQKERSEHT